MTLKEQLYPKYSFTLLPIAKVVFSDWQYYENMLLVLTVFILLENCGFQMCLPTHIISKFIKPIKLLTLLDLV